MLRWIGLGAGDARRPATQWALGQKHKMACVYLSLSGRALALVRSLMVSPKDKEKEKTAGCSVMGRAPVATTECCLETTYIGEWCRRLGARREES